VLEENSAVSSEKTRITEDSEKLCQVGIEQVKRVHIRRQNRWMFCGEDTPPGGHRESVQIGTEVKRTL
jgi:hypothetical protein